MTQLANVVMFPPDIYLNIWITTTVVDGLDGIAAIATMPGSTLPLDGIVIENRYVGGYGNIPEYLEGDLLVHEVGHYLGLYHTFQGGSCDAVLPGCAVNGDRCCDTPPVAQSNLSGCVDLNGAPCGPAEQLENYMDYTYDPCKNTFMDDQIDRMHATLLTFRADLVDPVNHIITGIAGPNGCTSATFTAAIIPNTTQLCTNLTVGQFDRVLAVDGWQFTFFNPNGGTLGPISSTPGPPSIPTTGSILFPTSGPWTITLSVWNTTPPQNTTATITVYVSDCSSVLLSQAQWYFGFQCALDFSSGMPVAIGGSAMNATEGCASICDGLSGTLEFYASNDRAFNSGHQILSPQLNGGTATSSAQGALIIPDQLNPDQYHLFTTREISAITLPAELHHSVVDMSLIFGGFSGDLVATATNISVGAGEPITTEHLSAVPHCNGVDYWIVTHGFDATTSDQLLSYLFTSTGIVTPAVQSPAFPVVPVPVGWGLGNNGIGHIEFNHDGDMAAITHASTNVCYVYSFDRENGTFDHIMDLPFGNSVVGVAFSRSGDFLYTATSTGIWQYDFRNLDLCNPLAPNNFHPFPALAAGIPSLQLGPDDKIYMTNSFTDYVSVINYPEVWNTLPNEFGFNWQGVTIEVPGNGVNEVCRSGLPNMIDAQPGPTVIDFTWCSTDCETVTFEVVGCGAVIEWDVDCNSTVDGTGDPFTWSLPGPGSYCVTLTVDGQTVTQTVDLLLPGSPDIQPDVVCSGVPVIFSTTNTAGLDHVWSITGAGTIMGSTTDETAEIFWTGPGTVTLDVTDASSGCTGTVTNTITPITFQPDIGPDITICTGEAVTLTELNGSVNCSWNPTSNLNLSDPCAPIFVSATPGIFNYSIYAADVNGCSGTDDIAITVDDAGCDPFTIDKSLSPSTGLTYAYTLVTWTLTVCNTTAAAADVDLTEQFPANFVIIGSNPLLGWSTPTTTLTVNLPAGSCETYTISGYFTTLGNYTNTATIQPVGSASQWSDDAEIEILQGCPMIVYGSGGCDPFSTVQLCLGMHTQLIDVTQVSYFAIYPNFLVAPPSGTITSFPSPIISSPFPLSSVTIGTPVPVAWPWNPQYGFMAVPITVVFSTPWTSNPPWPPYEVFCLAFSVGAAGVPTGINVSTTWSSTATGLGGGPGWNFSNVVTMGTSVDLLTQAYNIYFNGCTSVTAFPDASFTIDNVLCGQVTVTGLETDPDAVHSWTWGDGRTTPINGAQSFTYDYFSTITDQNGWPVVPPIGPAAPGTYTITHTVVLNGVASTDQQQVTIVDCCSTADITVPDGSNSSSIAAILTNTSINVEGLFTIDANLDLFNCQVFLEPGAEIVVAPGNTLVSDGCTFMACTGTMWKSITVQDCGTIRFANTMVADAENGVKCMDGSIAELYDCDLHRNRVGIQVPETAGVSYNTVTLVIANCEFTSYNMHAPYPGQTTVVGQKGYAGIEAHELTVLNLTAGGNVFHDLSNGVVTVDGDVRVRDCTFYDIQPDAAYAHPANGSAIYSRGENGLHYLDQEGFGMGAAQNFIDCRWGVYSEYMTVNSRENNMYHVGTAYRVDHSFWRSVDIWNNTLDTWFNGIDLRFNDGSIHTLVHDNAITFGSDLPPGVTTKGHSAIYVAEANNSNMNSVIQYNTITYRPGAETAARGIALSTARDFLVAENDLYMDNNAVNRFGIIAQGCERPLISCNYVEGSFGAYNVYDGQSAIRSDMNNGPDIICNDVDGTTNGIYFHGTNNGTELRGNNIRTHKWGLHLDYVAIIGVQNHKGNLWYNAPVVGGVGAWYENTSSAFLYEFKYDPTITIPGGDPEPPSVVPINWFVQQIGQNFECDDGIEPYCESHEHFAAGFAMKLDSLIASDSLENSPYTDESRWMLKGDLYEKLDNDPATTANNALLDAFYTDMQNTTQAQFKLINDDYLALFGLDAAVVDYLETNRVQLEDLMVDLGGAMEQLADTTLGDSTRQQVITLISGLQASISQLTTWNATALELAANSRVLSAENVRTENSGVGASELIEENERTVNDIYLNTIAKDAAGFTPAQTTALYNIAMQCPMAGGTAVYRARALYGLIDDDQDYDDASACLPFGIVYRGAEQLDERVVVVVPNPAMDQARLICALEEGQSVTLVLYDAIGREMQRHLFQWDRGDMSFSVTGLSSGTYHYVVSDNNGLVGEGKLSIMH